MYDAFISLNTNKDEFLLTAGLPQQNITLTNVNI